MGVSGINHLTLAVADLERSLLFYRDLLGFRPRALWPTGAYLEAGTLWLCLALDPAVTGEPRADYTHIAFDMEAGDFDALSDRVRAAAPVWKENCSEGHSLYVLDPDGHRVELHVGCLASRLERYREQGRPDMQIFA